MQRCAPAQHGVQHYFALQTASGIVVTLIWIAREALKDHPERAATSPGPPLVQITVRPIEMFVERFQVSQAVGKRYVKSIMVGAIQLIFHVRHVLL
jgi:hypothetical protein